MNASTHARNFALSDRLSAEIWAKAWRSDCIDSFAKAEMLIGALLAGLQASKRFTLPIKLGQQFRPSFETLRGALKAKGHWKKERGQLDSTLDPLEGVLDWRAHLTHGELKVWEGRAQWLLTLKHCDASGSGPIRWHAIPLSEATRLLGELQSTVDAFERGAQHLLEHYPSA